MWGFTRCHLRHRAAQLKAATGTEAPAPPHTERRFLARSLDHTEHLKVPLRKNAFLEKYVRQFSNVYVSIHKYS